MRNDLTIYDRYADDWWNDRSRAFRTLHSVNRFRIELLRDWLGAALSGSRVVDLGCGGGLLSERLCELGCFVLGIDLSVKSLQAARNHAANRRGRLYARADVLAAPVQSDSADLVLLADVMEHLQRPAAAMEEASRIVRAGGLVYVNTLTRSWLSRLLAIHLAEGIGFVPRGTHDAKLFVTPEELEAFARPLGLKLLQIQPESPRVLASLRARTIELRRGKRLTAAYSALFQKYS